LKSLPSWARWIQSIFSHPISSRSIFILSSYLCPHLLNSFISLDFRPKLCTTDIPILIRNIYDKKLYLTEFYLRVWQLAGSDMTACLPVTAQRDSLLISGWVTFVIINQQLCPRFLYFSNNHKCSFAKKKWPKLHGGEY
jgi:hypothetical protein